MLITDIGYDHMHILGYTLAIAAQKIGIVHDGNPVIMYHQSTEVSGVIEAWVRKHQAKLQPRRKPSSALPMGPFATDMPDYQQAQLAAESLCRPIGFLQERDGFAAAFGRAAGPKHK